MQDIQCTINNSNTENPEHISTIVERVIKNLTPHESED